MAKKFSELRNKMSPEAQARAKTKTNEIVANMALSELREARRLTQEQLAERFHVGQPAIAKIERRADMYVSTLRGIVHAMGGELEIRAVFPDGPVKITQFGDIGTEAGQ